MNKKDKSKQISISHQCKPIKNDVSFYVKRSHVLCDKNCTMSMILKVSMPLVSSNPEPRHNQI